jgi:hypothetical protein
MFFLIEGIRMNHLDLSWIEKMKQKKKDILRKIKPIDSSNKNVVRAQAQLRFATGKQKTV